MYFHSFLLQLKFILKFKTYTCFIELYILLHFSFTQYIKIKLNPQNKNILNNFSSFSVINKQINKACFNIKKFHNIENYN